MLHRRQLFVGAGALGGLAFAAPGAIAQPKGEFAAFRFVMRGSQPVAAMTVGASKPYLVLLDTGDTFGAALREDICLALNLDHVGTGRIYGATGTDTVEGYRAHHVIFGGTVLEPDITFMGSKSVAGLDGIVPLGLFTNRYTEMDFTEGLIRMQTSGEPDHAGFRPLRCDRLRDGGPFIADCEVAGIKARLLVDTGAATTVSLNPAFVKAHGLWEGHERFLPRGYRGITGAAGAGRTVKLKSLKVGAYRFQDPVVALGDPKLTLAAETFDGLLGIDILRRFTLGFDARAATIWLKPNDHLSDPFPYDHSGLVETMKDGVGVVVAASKGSPAEEAGLQPGDRLVALDSPAKFAAFDRSLLGAPDEVRSFEIERGGKRVPITMTLKDWL